MDRPLAGNGQVVVRVTSVENTNEWAKAGVFEQLQAVLLDELGARSEDEAPADEGVRLIGHSLGGPMTRVGSAWVG